MSVSPRSNWKSGKLEDLRIIACAISVGCMLIDDLPQPYYGTFRDPGAAAMLSIMLANGFTFISRRELHWYTWVVFGGALFLKFLIQPFFWFRNALAIDLATLTLFHTALALLALHGIPTRVRIITGLGTLVGICASVVGISAAGHLLSLLISPHGGSWITFWVECAAARVLIPIGFWTAVLCVEAHYQTSDPVSSNRAPAFHTRLENS